MVKGIIYNPNVEDLAKEQSGYMERLWEFNQLKPSEGASIFTGTKKSTGRISNKSGQISKI